MISSERCNVILVVADSARRDVFEAHAPTFRELSARGRRFDRAIAPSGWSLPSHVSMFTGLLPSEHGAVALGRGKDVDRKEARARIRELAKEGRVLAPRLTEKGIRSLSISANPWVGPLAGLDLGFTQSHFFGFLGTAPKGRRRQRKPGRMTELRAIAKAVRRHASWVRSGRDKGADVVLEHIEEFARADGTFFVFTNLIETHEPHLAPPSARTGGRWDRFLSTANVVLQPGMVRALRMRAHNWGTRKLPAGVLRRWWDGYTGETRYVDEWLGRLMQKLEKVGVADETVVIVTADHGENFGEGGVVGHGMSLRSALANVPLGMWGAGIEARPATGDPVSLMQLPDTIEGLLLGEERERSLLHSTGTATMEIEDPVLVSRPPSKARRRSRGPGAAFYDGNLKYVVDPFEGEQLFDLANDPGESRNILDRAQPTSRQIAERAAWEERLKITRPS